MRNAYNNTKDHRRMPYHSNAGRSKNSFIAGEKTADERGRQHGRN